MKIYESAVRKPVSTVLLFVGVMVFGLFSLMNLAVDQYPEIEIPQISVITMYPGANAAEIETNITRVLEDNLNTVSNLKKLTSKSQDNVSMITVEFEYGSDLNEGANEIRDVVSRVQSMLPDDIDYPTIFKFSTSMIPVMMIAVTAEESYPALNKLLDDKLVNVLNRVDGVGAVSVIGAPEREVQVNVDPAKLDAYNLTVEQLGQIIAAENVNIPSGTIDIGNNTFNIKADGEFKLSDELRKVVVSNAGGRTVMLSDVAEIRDTLEKFTMDERVNGQRGVRVMFQKQSGANTVNIVHEIQKRLPEIQKTLPKDVKMELIFEGSQEITDAIGSLSETIMYAFIFVVLVVMIFLGRWRATLIICMTIPVSLICSFIYLFATGSTLNIISLSSLSIAIGMVVDDAIVMTENIYIRIERGMTPFDAGIEGAKEIFFAVISTSITLIAVFFPIVFMEGMTGRLFREFSLVISGAVVISTFAALTITPMLATKLLVRQEKQSWFYNKTEPFFVWLNNFYSRTLAGFLRRRWIALPLVALMIGLIGWLWGSIPAEMAPLEDRSQITINTRGSEGATYEYLRDYTEGINRLVDSLVPEARAVTARVSSGRGNVQIALKDIATRERTQMEIAEVVSAAVRTRTKARAFVQQQSTFGGRRGSMPVQYVLQATNIERLQEVLPEFMRKVYESPVFQMADVDLKFSKPEARIAINRDKANLLGVSTRNIAQTLQYGLSGQRLGYFYMNGKQYEILAEINRQQRNKPADLKSIYVRSDKGEMIQLDNLITLEENVAPPQLYHYNRFLSATVSAGLAKGKTIGQGLDEMDRIAEQTLGDDFRTALAGDSKEFRESSSSLIFAFLLAIVLIYLILAAQFESFKDPLVIMLTVPLAIAGALVFMAANGQTMNIFSQIGIIMLIGLVAKNGILIVEFANQKQDAGLNKREAIEQASLQRLRPILMTSASTILGLLPLTVASGEGAQGRIAMGIAVVGGMVVSTLLTLYIVPAIYSYVSTDRIRKTKKNAK